MEIQLKDPKEIVLVKQVCCFADTIKINHIIHYPTNLVEAEIVLCGKNGEQVQTWTLWENKKVGEYTEQDCLDRLNELIK